MLLSVHGISKNFGSRPVLQNVSFSVLEGEMLGLIGPNGAGKTTLFESLAGLISANAGEVTFRGRLVSATERKQALFYLPDGIRPWPDQPLDFVLAWCGGLYQRSREEVKKLASDLGLDSLLKSRIRSLSKGELKRALLGIGLLTRQELLLLDEPFDGLDLRQAKDVMALLKDHASQGRTLFLSIHQLNDASRVCSRFVLLSAGLAVAEGTLPELLTKAGLEQGGLEEVFLALT